jgi:hypothetical protein
MFLAACIALILLGIPAAPAPVVPGGGSAGNAATAEVSQSEPSGTAAYTGPHADRVHVSADSDLRAVGVAQRTMEAMGGWDAWDRVRYLHWAFFGRREHWWDRRTGDVRIDAGKRLVLMNVNARTGRVWEDGREITHPDSLAEALDVARQWWVNDSYWLIMPTKLLDPGVTLRHGGEAKLPDGGAADKVILTFDEGVGYTPQNKYDVYVARDTDLVEQWSYYGNASDPEPAFTLPWAGWKDVGGFLIATDHGRGEPWPVEAPRELPRAVFTDPGWDPR